MIPYNDDFYKKLQNVRSWQFIVGQKIAEHYKLKSVIDFGSGNGYYLEGAQQAGAKIKGLEYSYETCKPYIPEKVLPFVEFQDFTQPQLWHGYFDGAFSFEVGEHLEKEYAEGFVRNICIASPLVFFSAAWPNQSGTNHVNLQPPKYWLDIFESFNYYQSYADSDIIKNIYASLPSQSKYTNVMRRNVMVIRSNSNDRRFFKKGE